MLSTLLLSGTSFFVNDYIFPLSPSPYLPFYLKVHKANYNNKCTQIQCQLYKSTDCTSVSFESQSKSVSYHLPLKWASLRAHQRVRDRTTDTHSASLHCHSKHFKSAFFHDHWCVSLYRSDNESSIGMDFPLFSSFKLING